MMECVQRGTVVAQTETTRLQTAQTETTRLETTTTEKKKKTQKQPQKQSQKYKYKVLRRKHKALRRKYTDLEKEIMRRQMAFDLRMEILVKERGVRESLFTHAISELESKLAAFTNAQ